MLTDLTAVAEAGILISGDRITLNETIKEYWRRLFDMIWFMRDLNEYIAREANKEDH